jgi:hypothetical protein
MVLEIGVVADKSDSVKLPVLNKSFHDDGCFLYSPITSSVVTGEECYFEIDLPSYMVAYLSDGKNRFLLTKRDDSETFFSSIKVPVCK